MTSLNWTSLPPVSRSGNDLDRSHEHYSEHYVDQDGLVEQVVLSHPKLFGLCVEPAGVTFAVTATAAVKILMPHSCWTSRWPPCAHLLTCISDMLSLIWALMMMSLQLAQYSLFFARAANSPMQHMNDVAWLHRASPYLTMSKYKRFSYGSHPCLTWCLHLVVPYMY